jgi:hypothetical protein
LQSELERQSPLENPAIRSDYDEATKEELEGDSFA